MLPERGVVSVQRSVGLLRVTLNWVFSPVAMRRLTVCVTFQSRCQHVVKLPVSDR